MIWYNTLRFAEGAGYSGRGGSFPDRNAEICMGIYLTGGHNMKKNIRALL